MMPCPRPEKVRATVAMMLRSLGSVVNDGTMDQ